MQNLIFLSPSISIDDRLTLVSDQSGVFDFDHVTQLNKAIGAPILSYLSALGVFPRERLSFQDCYLAISELYRIAKEQAVPNVYLSFAWMYADIVYSRKPLDVLGFYIENVELTPCSAQALGQLIPPRYAIQRIF